VTVKDFSWRSWAADAFGSGRIDLGLDVERNHATLELGRADFGPS